MKQSILQTNYMLCEEVFSFISSEFTTFHFHLMLINSSFEGVKNLLLGTESHFEVIAVVVEAF